MFYQIPLFLNLGTQELILIMFVALLLFGGKKLPELARGLGKGLRDFKEASDGLKTEINNQINTIEEAKAEATAKIEEVAKEATEKIEGTANEATEKIEETASNAEAEPQPPVYEYANFETNHEGGGQDGYDYYEGGGYSEPAHEETTLMPENTEPETQPFESVADDVKTQTEKIKSEKS